MGHQQKGRLISSDRSVFANDIIAFYNEKYCKKLKVFNAHCFFVVVFFLRGSCSGHEFPFSIQMSHVRHSMSQGGGAAAGSASPASPVDREKILQKELLQVNRQCQFVLKPRPAEEQQLLLQEPSGQTTGDVVTTVSLWDGEATLELLQKTVVI